MLVDIYYNATTIGSYINKVGVRINRTQSVINGIAVEFSDGTRQIDDLFKNDPTSDPYMPTVDPSSLPYTYEGQDTNLYESEWVSLPDGFDKLNSRIVAIQFSAQLSLLEFYRNNVLVASISGIRKVYIAGNFSSTADHDKAVNMQISVNTISTPAVILPIAVSSKYAVTAIMPPVPVPIPVPVIVTPIPVTPISNNYSIYLLYIIAFIFVCILYMDQNLHDYIYLRLSPDL
jgi:hypothetical protein